MFTYQNRGQGRAGLSAVQAEGVWAKACPAGPLLLQPGLHQTALPGRQLMPLGGQWAGLAQAAPQGLAAVMHPLYSSKCFRNGKEKGRKVRREGKARAGRREGNGREKGRKGQREGKERAKRREAKGKEKGQKGQDRAKMRKRQSGSKKWKHCKRQESSYSQMHRKSDGNRDVWAKF